MAKSSKIIQLYDRHVTDSSVLLYPITTTEAVVDSNGATLNSVLSEQINNDFLNVNRIINSSIPYETQAAARNDVSTGFRAKGLCITYLLGDSSTWIQEQFIGGNPNTGWTSDSNWQTLGPVSVINQTVKVGNKELFGIDDEAKKDSDNLIKSKSIYDIYTDLANKDKNIYDIICLVRNKTDVGILHDNEFYSYRTQEYRSNDYCQYIIVDVMSGKYYSTSGAQHPADFSDMPLIVFFDSQDKMIGYSEVIPFGTSYAMPETVLDLPYGTAKFLVQSYNGNLGGNVQLVVKSYDYVEYKDILNVNEINNCITTPYINDIYAKAAIPVKYRKHGLKITWLSGGGWITEQFVGSDITNWTDIDQWQNIELDAFNISLNNKANFMHSRSLTPVSVTANSYVKHDGTIGSSNAFSIYKYSITPGNLYSLTSDYIDYSRSGPFVTWFDNNNNFISCVPIFGNAQSSQHVEIAVIAPANAVYACVNIETSLLSIKWCFVEHYDNISNADIKVFEDKAIIDDITLQGKLFLMTPVSVNIGHYIKNTGVIGTNAYFNINKYGVTPGRIYAFTSKNDASTGVIFIFWADINENIIKIEPYGGRGAEYTDQLIIAPDNAAYALFNINIQLNVVECNFKQYINMISGSEQELLKKHDYAISNTTETVLEKTTTIGKWYNAKRNQFVDNANMLHVDYAVTPLTWYHIQGYGAPSGFSALNYINYFDNYDNFIGYESYIASPFYQDTPLLVCTPPDCVKIVVNSTTSYQNVICSAFTIQDVIKSKELQRQIDIINAKSSASKLVITAMTGININPAFYIRTRYNATKDIILVHRLNDNGLITFAYTYIGAKTLTDAQLMTSTYLVSAHTDSTAPLLFVKQYWHLFAQHGYPVPTIANSTGLTNDDIGSTWKDQLDRQYTIGKVTTDTIWLLPVIYQSGGHYVRDWQSMAYSADITALTHVSGAVHTSTITVSDYNQVQLRPIMQHSERQFIIDGLSITEPGIYYYNNLTINESQVGYDPATISDWFGGTDGHPDLTGALPMAKFTWSYNYCGAQCAMNTTIHILREVECDSYGAIQQQFFYDKGNYQAMFMLPKAATVDGVELDKPFHSGSSNATTYTLYRTSASLKDVNDIVDRQVGFLYDNNNDSYLVGMAAGLSLVSGDTVVEKRNQNCMEGNTNSHYRVLIFSPANTNKFYIAAFNTAQFASNDYYIPEGFFKEINTYISYFDPAENTGQVYWYKDGNSYVIYCHCQSQQTALAINMPQIMEGLNLSVVEKTDDVELLTDKITNGKFFVNYNSADANYIVLKTN